MKKLICMIMVTLVTVGCFAGCAAVDAEHVSDSPQTRFEVVEASPGDTADFRYLVLVDTETGVLYLYMRTRNSSNATGGITVLLNPDGTPMTLED